MSSPQTSRRILIADDEPGVLRMLSQLLAHWGYEAVLARDGAEALGTLRTDGSLRLAILDWNMPGVDGLEVCRQARDLRPSSPPYLILLTGRGGQEDLIAGLVGGADEYLPKPIDPEELRARLLAAWRIVDLQSDLTSQVRHLEEAPLVREIVGEEHPGLRQTLRLCAATIAETLAFDGLPRHLRVALRTCRGLCLESLGDDDRPGHREEPS